MEYEKKEQVIFVKDLLFAALYQWRKILIGAVILALILGGVSFLNQRKAAETTLSDEEAQSALAEFEENKARLEQDLENTEKALTNQENYLSQSPIMLMDPYGVYQASIEVTVQSDYQILPGMQYQNPDYTSAILRAYTVYLTGDEVINTIAASLSHESKYFTEMVSITNGGGDTRSLSIYISYPTRDGAQQIADMFTDYLSQAQKQISQNGFEHEIKVISSSVNERIDHSVTTKQQSARSNLEELKTRISTLETELNALTMPTLVTGISKKKVVLFAMIGAILGAGLVACVAWLNHIAGGKIYSPRTLTNKTGIRVLGSIPVSAHRSVDKWLRKLEGRSVGDNHAALAAANIRYYCKDAKSILLLMDCAEEQCQPVLDAIAQAGITANIHNSPLCSAEALAAIPNADAVVVFGQCGVSRYNDAEKIAELLADQGKLLAGYVLLDG